MKESIEAWKVIVLCIEYFCFGSFFFTASKKTKKILMLIVWITSFIVCLACRKE